MVVVEEDACEGSLTGLYRVHAMVNVDNVTHWFRDATSDSRIDILCRLLECCTPLELQFLGTYLEELLQRNMVFNKPSETIATLYSNLNDLKEITNSNSRRQLCVLLTRLKSANTIPAYNIYDILIQYDFAEFFSHVISMEEELVDEILLLFSLAANHPAMTFSQRRHLLQRLVDLRGTIENSFECHQVDVCLPDDHKYLWSSPESENTTKGDQECLSLPKLSPTHVDVVSPSAEAKDKSSKETLPVHIKDLKIVKVQQRPYGKKLYEYVFEVTWSNGRVVEIHRGYGELFEFQLKVITSFIKLPKQCRKLTRIIMNQPVSLYSEKKRSLSSHNLRQRFPKDGSKVSAKRIIPYLPTRKPIKYCKGNDILPDISDYVREFVQLPDKLLHNEWVESFFRDGNERNLVETNQQTLKSKQNSSPDKKESLNCVSRQTNTPRANAEIKPDKGSGVLKKNSPKAKWPTLTSSKKSTSSHHTSGKLESKKRNLNGPKISPIGTVTSSKERNNVKTATNHLPEVNLKSSISPSSRSVERFRDKTRIARNENKEKTVITAEDITSLVSIKTNLPHENFRDLNGHGHNTCAETVVPLVKVERELDKTSTTASQTPLTVAVPIQLSACTTCLASSQLLSDGSLTSSMSTSPLGSPATSFSLEPSLTSSQASSPDHRQVDFATELCSPEMNKRIKSLKLFELQKYEWLLKDFSDEEVLKLSDSDIDKMEMTKTERQNVQTSNNNLKSSRGFGRNGFSVDSDNIHPSMSQHGLLIVRNGYANASENTKTLDKNCNFIPQNGQYHRNFDIDHRQTYDNEQKTRLNQKSNGFSKPYCYNCGDYGHIGYQCLETQIEEPSVS